MLSVNFFLNKKNSISAKNYETVIKEQYSH